MTEPCADANWPTNLGDLVVVGQEHGQILRLLDGRRLRHFPEELGGSEGEAQRV